MKITRFTWDFLLFKAKANVGLQTTRLYNNMFNTGYVNVFMN